MDEDLYRSTYKELNPNRCIFEKAITNQRCDCELKRKFILANRECVSCESAPALDFCTTVLNSIRNNALFSLKAITIDGPMPHNKELQVQAGGMLALQNLLHPSPDLTSNDEVVTPNVVSNIHQTINDTLFEYQSLDKFPYGEIIKGIVAYKTRPKRQKK